MTTIYALQIVLSVLLIGSILLQSSAGGLGSAFGGSGAYHTKRGVEKTMFVATIVIACLFTLISILALIVR